MPCEISVGSASTGHVYRLTRVDICAVVLGQFGRDLDARGVDEIGNELSRVGGIANADTPAWVRRSRSPPNAIMLGLTVTKPSKGARTRRLSMLRRGDLDGDARLVALLAPAPLRMRASGLARWLFTSCSSCASRWRASSSSSRFCFATMAPTSSLALASSSARRTSNRALSRATSSSAACTAASACGFRRSPARPAADRTRPARARTPDPTDRIRQ